MLRIPIKIVTTCFLLALFFVCAQLVRAASISGVSIDSVTATSAVVSWTTDVPTDAIINYGLDTSFGLVRDPTFTNKAHSLTIPNLAPLTTYHFRVQSTDSNGNTDATAGLTFTTPLDTSNPAAASDLVKKIIDMIKKLKNPNDFLVVDKALKDAAGSVLKPPIILGAAKVTPTTDGAEFAWTTDRASGSVVNVEPDSTYDANASNPYSITQGDSSESVTTHDVKVIGLSAATTYHFAVSSSDSVGLIGATADDTFDTKSLLPLIQSPKVTGVGETTATISWSTGSVLAKGLVSYTDQRTHATRSVGSPAFLDKQSIELTGLVLGSSYQAVITATNKSGDAIDSKPFVFVTTRDVVPPVISKVNNQSTLFPSDNVQVQTIISWQTDKPSTCQLLYINGIVKSASNPVSSQPAEKNPLTDHIEVIVGLEPSAVYKFWIACKDTSGNQAQSDDYVLITPTKQKNIIDVILQNFQGTFGWLNNVGK